MLFLYLVLLYVVPLLSNHLFMGPDKESFYFSTILSPSSHHTFLIRTMTQVLRLTTNCFQIPWFSLTFSPITDQAREKAWVLFIFVPLGKSKHTSMSFYTGTLILFLLAYSLAKIKPNYSSLSTFSSHLYLLLRNCPIHHRKAHSVSSSTFHAFLGHIWHHLF
jgi:hypothetical protein